VLILPKIKINWIEVRQISHVSREIRKFSVVLVVSDSHCGLSQRNCLRTKNHGAPLAGFFFFFFFLEKKNERRLELDSVFC